jgi:hypothetical protein
MWLLAYRSVRCQTAGNSSSSTAGYTERMVGDDLNRRDLGRADGPLQEAAGSPPVTLGGDKISMTWPNWSMARYS